MTTFLIKQGDTLPVMTATLLGDDGLAADLTGATLTMRFSPPSGDTVESAAVIVAPLLGTVEYTFTAAQTALPGRGRAEFVATFPGGVQTFPPDDPILVEISRKL